MKISKILAGMSAAAIAASMMSFASLAADDTTTGTGTSVVTTAETEKTLFESETGTTFDSNWKLSDGDYIKISPEALGELKAGDKISVTAKIANPEDGESKVTIQNGSWADIAWEDAYPVVTDDKETYDFVLTDELIEAISGAYGDEGATALVAKGGNVTITKVTLIPATVAVPEDKTLFESETGTTFDSNWKLSDGDYIKISPEALGELKAGDKISVTAKIANPEDGESKVTIQNGSWADIAWEDAYPVVTDDKETYDFVLTDELIEAISGAYGDEGATALVVKGGNVTVTKVVLTPATEPITPVDPTDPTDPSSENESSSNTDSDSSSETDPKEVKPLFSSDDIVAKVLFENWAGDKSAVKVTGAELALLDGTTIDVPLDNDIMFTTPGNENQYNIIFAQKNEDGEMEGSFVEDDVWTQITGIKFKLQIDEEYLNHVLTADEDGYYINGGVAVIASKDDPNYWPDWTKWGIQPTNPEAKKDDSIVLEAQPVEGGAAGEYVVMVGAENVIPEEDEDPTTEDNTSSTKDTSSSKKDDGSSKKDDGSKKDNGTKDPNANANTGAAAGLAALGVALAGAAVVASKKRK